MTPSVHSSVVSGLQPLQSVDQTILRQCRDLGFGVNDTQVLLGLADNPERDCVEARGIAKSHLAVVRSKVAELRNLERSLTRFVQSCDQECAAGLRRSAASSRIFAAAQASAAEGRRQPEFCQLRSLPSFDREADIRLCSCWRCRCPLRLAEPESSRSARWQVAQLPCALVWARPGVGPPGSPATSAHSAPCPCDCQAFAR
jgi:DNA-binding transcriptional MerR regulator